jgi:predicted AAA+ superfamily ATPase
MIRKNTIPRLLDIAKLLNKKSFFLFGCRGTGKTSLIKASLPELARYDLLDATTFANLSRRPQLIGEENTDATAPVVIDEIQKLPQLLDEVHRPPFASTLYQTKWYFVTPYHWYPVIKPGCYQST